MNTTTVLPGEWMDQATLIGDLDFSQWEMRVPTNCYHSVERAQEEFERLWMKTWQIAGREEEIPHVGDWKVFKLVDQSFLIIRGKDGRFRAFVN